MAWYFDRDLHIDRSGKFVVLLSSERVKHIFTINQLSDESKLSLINSYAKLGIPINICIKLHNVSKDEAEKYIRENGIKPKRIPSYSSKMKCNDNCKRLAREFKNIILGELCNVIRDKDDLSKYTWDVLDSMCIENLGYNAQVCFFVANVFSLVTCSATYDSIMPLQLKEFNHYMNIFSDDNEFFYDSDHFYNLCKDLYDIIDFEKDNEYDDNYEEYEEDDDFEDDDEDDLLGQPRNDFHIEPDNKNIISQIIKTYTYFNFSIDNIANIYNLSQHDIEYILKNANIEIKCTCPDIEKLERVKRLKKHNQWTNSYIANEFGVSIKVINYILGEDTESNVNTIDPSSTPSSDTSDIKSDFNDDTIDHDPESDISLEVKDQIVNTYTKFGIGVISLASIFGFKYLYIVDDILCEKLGYKQGVANSGNHMMTTNIYCKENIKHVLFLIGKNKDRLEIAKLFGVSKEAIDFIYDNCNEKTLFNIYDKDNSSLYKNNIIDMEFPYNGRSFNNIDISKLRIGEEVTLKISGSINSLATNYIGITTSGTGKTIVVDIDDAQL